MTLDEALLQLREDGLRVPPATAAALRRGFLRFSGQISKSLVDLLEEKMQAGLQSINLPKSELRDGSLVTTGDSTVSLVDRLTKILAQQPNGDVVADSLNLRFKIGTATQVMRGAGNYLTDQTDVDIYPAWELVRLYDRAVPRGQKVGPKGTLVEVPGDAWDTDDGRWVAACDDAGDDDALQVFKDTGRMVALKSSDVWQSLGDGAGGYDDTLGNPFPPFAFNSGYGVEPVTVKEAVKLGLLDEGETPKAATIDFGKLFSFPA